MPYSRENRVHSRVIFPASGYYLHPWVGRRNGAKFNESKSLPTSTTNLQFNIFFFYINNKIRPTSTINIIINIRNMPNSTTKENHHQQKFLSSSATNCLKTKIDVSTTKARQQRECRVGKNVMLAHIKSTINITILYGYIPTSTDTHLPSLVLSYLHFYSLFFTCNHLHSLVLTFLHFYSLSFTCANFPSLVLTFLHLCSLSFTRSHFLSLVLTFLPLYSLTFTCTLLPSLIRTYLHTRTHLPSLLVLTFLHLYSLTFTCTHLP